MNQLTVSIIAMMLFFSCAGQRPDNIGVDNKRLAECPGKKNCVNSQSADENYFIEPFQYKGSKEAAFQKLKKSIASFEQFTKAEENEDYLRYECKSTVMGFVDDLEFYFSQDKLIHVRSASRLGYSDLGVNRKRVEKLRKLFYEDGKK